MRILMFVSCPLFCPVDVGTNPNGKVSDGWPATVCRGEFWDTGPAF